jgi:hypothetical protein
MKMSDKEINIIYMMQDLYDEYESLESQHPKDKEEFIYHLHCLQYLIMIRSVRREHPDIFPIHINKDITLDDLANVENLNQMLSDEINKKINLRG